MRGSGEAKMLASPVREGPGVKIHFPVWQSQNLSAQRRASSKGKPITLTVSTSPTGGLQETTAVAVWSTHPKLTQTFDSTDEIFSTTYAYELHDL